MALYLGRVCLAASDFWNKKPASEWTADDIERLRTRSPWAKEVNAGMQPEINPNRTATEPGIGGTAGDPSADAGRYGGLGGYDSGSARGAKRNEAITIRWESAQPVLDATKETLPADFANHYVISVTGMPLNWDGRRPSRRRPSEEDSVERLSDLVERLKAGATLEAKGRDGEQAGVVRRSPTDESWLFGFSKELMPLSVNDKDIIFSLKAGPRVVSAKFEPKEMVYKGKLAL